MNGLALSKGLVAKETLPERHVSSAIQNAGFACGEVSCSHELVLTPYVMEKVKMCLGLFVKGAVKPRN